MSKVDSADDGQADELPWQWQEQRWRAIVEKVRAGRSLKPKVWKDGAACAGRPGGAGVTAVPGSARGLWAVAVTLVDSDVLGSFVEGG